MATKHEEFFAALGRPFHPDEIRERSHDKARYITARHVMNRLDEVVGPEYWTAEYESWSDDAVLCRLTITLPDGVTKLTKCDVGSYTNMAEKNSKAEPGDDDKGGFSDALKRTAVLFGIGRHLYRNGVPSFVYNRYAEDGQEYGAEEPPQPPRGESAATRRPDAHPPAPEPRHEPQGRPSGPSNGDAPRTGKALFARVKDLEQQHEVNLLKYINNFGKLQDWPMRMVDWDSNMVATAYAEIMRKLVQVGMEQAHQEAMSN